LLIDLDLRGKRALVIGGGREAELKALKLVDSGARTTVLARRFTKGIRRLARDGDLRLVRRAPERAAPFILKTRPKVLFISTGGAVLDEGLARAGRDVGSLVCVVDTPELNDFNMPAIARVGSVRVAISTGGKSPAVAKLLRKRVERLILPEDVLQVELQQAVREELRQLGGSPSERRRMVYSIVRDGEVTDLLRQGRLPQARERASLIMKERGRARS